MHQGILSQAASTVSPASLRSSAAVRKHFASRRGLLLLFDDVLVFAPDGHLIADTPELPARAALNTADRQYFKQVLLTKRPVIGDPVISKIRKEAIVQIAAPVLDANGNVAAVVVGVLRLGKSNFLGGLAVAKVARPAISSP